MPQLDLHAGGSKLRQHGGKARKLRLCIGNIVRGLGVRHAEVRERTLDAQVPHTADREQLLRRLRRAVGEEADARHAGIELEMDIQDVIRAGEGLFQRLSVFERVYLLRDVHKDHAVGIFGRRIAEDQDRRADARAANLNGLLQIGDGEIGRAEIGQRLADRDGPVSVGIGLDDAKEAAAGWDMAHDGVVVMFQIIHGHIGPGSFECFHIMPRK